MEANTYQWPTDVTSIRNTRTDTIAMELHRLGCNVSNKLREEHGLGAKAHTPHAKTASNSASSPALKPAHNSVHNCSALSSDRISSQSSARNSADNSLRNHAHNLASSCPNPINSSSQKPAHKSSHKLTHKPARHSVHNPTNIPALSPVCAPPRLPPLHTQSTHSVRSAPSRQGFAPAATHPPHPQPPPPLPPPPPFHRPSLPLVPRTGSACDARPVQADGANFHRLKSPALAPLALAPRPPSLSSLPSPTPTPLPPTPPPSTPRSPLPPAGVLCCPSPHFAFNPPAPYPFRSLSPMLQPYHKMADQQQQQQQQQQVFQMMHEQDPFVQYTQYKEPGDVSQAEHHRRRHSRSEQRRLRGDISRGRTAETESPDLLPGHVLWPEVNSQLREKIVCKRDAPARVSETRHLEKRLLLHLRRRRAHPKVKEPLEDTDTSSSEFFWNVSDDEIVHRVHDEIKAKVEAGYRSKHAPSTMVSRRYPSHGGMHRSREWKGQSGDSYRSMRRHVAGDKRRHERSDSNERHVKLRRAEYDPLYPEEVHGHRSRRSRAAGVAKAYTKPSDIYRNALKGGIGKYADGSGRRLRERPEMGDSSNPRRHSREMEKTNQRHGTRRRSPQKPEPRVSTQRDSKQPGAEDPADKHQLQPQQPETFIELVKGPEKQYFEQARENTAQVQQPEGWFNNLPTIAEMKNEESPGTSRTVQQTASTDNKRRVPEMEMHLQSNNTNIIQNENDLKTRKLTEEDGAQEQGNASQLNHILNPPGAFSEVQNISPPLAWAAGRNTQVYTAHVTTLNKPEQKCVQSTSESGSVVQKALFDHTWPKSLPDFLTHQNKSPSRLDIEKASRPSANDKKLDQQPNEKEYERITIISIQHDKDSTLKDTKQIIQSAKDDIQQSVKLAAEDFKHKKSNELKCEMVSKSTQRGRSPGAEDVPAKQSRSVGTHCERSHRGSRLRRVQITPIVRFRRAPPIAFQSISKISEMDCKSNGTPSDNENQPIMNTTVQTPNNSPNNTLDPSTNSAVVESEKHSSHHSVSTSSKNEPEGMKSSTLSESRSRNKLRSVTPKSSKDPHHGLSRNRVQPSLTLENKKHAKDHSATGVTSSVSELQSAHVTSKVESQAMKCSQENTISSLGGSGTDLISSVPNESNSKLSDVSWQTINEKHYELQKNSKSALKCPKNDKIHDKTHDKGVSKTTSTEMTHKKKLTNTGCQTLNMFPMIDTQTTSVPTKARLRSCDMLPSHELLKHYLHGSENLKKQPLGDVLGKSKHSVYNSKIVKKSSANNQQNITNMSEAKPLKVNETLESQKHLIQNDTSPQKTEINPVTLIPANENTILSDKYLNTSIQQAMENNLQNVLETNQESIEVSPQEIEMNKQIMQQHSTSNNLNVKEAPVERMQNDRKPPNSPRHVRISLPPSNTLKGILKSPTHRSENQRKPSVSPHSGSKPFPGEPNLPSSSTRQINHHQVTCSKVGKQLPSQKIQKAKNHKPHKRCDIKPKDTQNTTHSRPPSNRTSHTNERNLSADVKRLKSLQTDAPPFDKLPRKVNERNDKSSSSSSDMKQKPMPADPDQDNQFAKSGNGNAQETQGTEKNLKVPSEFISKSTEPSTQNIHSNSQIQTEYISKSTQLKQLHSNSHAASLKRLVKELTAVAKDLHRTVVNDLRHMENVSPKEIPVDSSKQTKLPSNANVEHTVSVEEKENECVFTTSRSENPSAEIPNSLNCVEVIKPQADDVHLPQNELPTETHKPSKLHESERKQPHLTLKYKSEPFRRTNDAETMRMKPHFVRNMTHNEPTFADKKTKNRVTKISNSSRTTDEQTQKHLATTGRNQEQSGIVMKRIAKSELKDSENLQKNHVVTMRDVQKSSSSFSRRFQRRSVVHASHQRHKCKDVKALQEINENKKDPNPEMPSKSSTVHPPEIEISNVLLHSETNLTSNEELFQKKLYFQGNSTPEVGFKKDLLHTLQNDQLSEATTKCFLKTPAVQIQQLSRGVPEHGRHRSSSHLQFNKEGINNQRLLQPPATISRINQQSTHTSQELTTQSTDRTLTTQKGKPEIVCIKDPPNPGGKFERKSLTLSNRIKNIVGNGLKRNHLHQATRTKITANIINLSFDNDRKFLTKGIRSVNQHSSTARRDRIQKPNMAQLRLQNYIHAVHQPKASGAFNFRQQRDSSVKGDKNSSNAPFQKAEKIPSVQQSLRDKTDRVTNHSSARTEESEVNANVSRHLLRRRVVKKRRVLKLPNPTRRIKGNTTNGPPKLNPVEQAEIAEIESALSMQHSEYLQPPSDGAMLNFPATPFHREAQCSKTFLFPKRRVKSSESRSRHKMIPAATVVGVAGETRGIKSTAKGKGLRKQTSDISRYGIGPVKRETKGHRDSGIVGVDVCLSSRDTLEIPTVGHVGKPANRGKHTSSDGVVRKERLFSKRIESTKRRESKRNPKSFGKDTSSWKTDSSGGSFRGSKLATPCDSVSSFTPHKKIGHKTRNVLKSPLTCFRSRQTPKSPPCEFLMRPIELSERTSSKLLGIEGLNLPVND